MPDPYRRPTIGIVGCFQNGKSTLVNCLLDDKVATTGSGKATTRLSTVFSYGEFQQAKALDKKASIESVLPFAKYLNHESNGPCKHDCYHVSLWKPLLLHVDIIDTPGFYANDEDDKVARSSLENLDVVVLVVRNKGLSEVEHSVLQAIAERELSFVVVMNCMETMGALWDPASEANDRIAREIEARLRNIGHVPHPIDGKFVFPVNLAWFWYASGHLAHENDDTALRLHRAVDGFFELEPSERQTPDHIAQASHFLPLRHHLELLATHFGMARSQAGERARALMAQSWDTLQNKKTDIAMIHAERACYIAPGFQPALQNRAAICLAREEFDETIHAATRALEIDARDVDTLFLRAKALFSQQAYHKARIDLLRIAELLQSDWHIAWADNDKAVQSRKLVEAYLMRMECDQREGKTDDAIAALRYIIDCDEQPMEHLDDAHLHLLVWCLSAGLEYRLQCYERAMHSAAMATGYCSELNETPVELIELCKWFDLQNGDCSVGGSPPLGAEIQRILWKACLKKHSDIEGAVGAFVKRNRLPVSMTTWQDEAAFVPYFISIVGREYNEFNDMATFIEQYFLVSGDENLHGFMRIAQQGLADGVLSTLKESVKLLCNISTSTAMFGNSVTITNVGNPILSDITVNITYSLNGNSVQKTLKLPKGLKKTESYRWDNVFEGKGVFGGLLGGKKLSDVRIVAVNSKQGAVKIV